MVHDEPAREPTASAHATARDHAAIYLAQNAPLTVYHQQAPFEVTDLALVPRPLPVEVSRQPSRLLAAASRVVPFHGRLAELASLSAWRDDRRHSVAIRLVSGPAGQGKSRLAMQFATLCDEAGWAAFEARRLTPGRLATRPGVTVAVASDAPRRLLVVDYCDRWPVADLLTLLLDGGLYHGTTRIVLLARSIGTWWQSVTTAIDRELGLQAQVSPLGPIAGLLADRKVAFAQARDGYARILGVADPETIRPPDDLGAKHYGLVLSVHMAALARVYAKAGAEPAPTNEAALSAYLLRREQDYWRLLYEDASRRTRPEVLGRAAYLATLTGSLPFAAATALLGHVGLAGDNGRAGAILDDHAHCYPPADPATVLEPLYPDRLGEDFVALQTPGHEVAEHRADPWTATAFQPLIGAADDDPRLAACLPHVVSGLVEASKRWPHVAHELLFPLLRERPDIAVRAGAPVLTALTSIPDLDLSVLAAVESTFPAADAGLADAMATITKLLYEQALARRVDLSERAEVAERAASRLIDAGRHTEALPAIVSAVKIRRTFRDKRDGPERVRLAASLAILATALAGGGRATEAAAAMDESVRLHASTEPPDFAQTARQAALRAEAAYAAGDPDTAAKLQSQATTAWKRAAAHDGRFALDLVRSHEETARYLTEADRTRSALAEWHHAVRIWRRLQDQQPAEFEPFLAAALDRYCALALAIGDGLDASALARETAQRFRRLADRDVSYEPALARALIRWASTLPSANPMQTLAVFDEAIRITDRLIRVNAERHGFARAHTLRLAAAAARDARQREREALDWILDAVRLLAGGTTPAHVRERAQAHQIAADLLEALGRQREAAALRRLSTRRQAAQPGLIVQRSTARPNAAPTEEKTDKLCGRCGGSGVEPSAWSSGPPYASCKGCGGHGRR